MPSLTVEVYSPIMKLGTFTLTAALASLDVVAAKELWSTNPAGYAPMRDANYILKTGYPVGNGKLGGTITRLE